MDARVALWCVVGGGMIYTGRCWAAGTRSRNAWFIFMDPRVPSFSLSLSLVREMAIINGDDDICPFSRM